MGIKMRLNCSKLLVLFLIKGFNNINPSPSIDETKNLG